MALTRMAGALPVAASTRLPPFTAQTRLLVLAPHPDDETIANGLLIQQVRAAGGTVGIVLLTNGDNNPWPQRWLERRWVIRADDRARWGNRRRGEVREALQRLDVPTVALQSLDWPDMGVTAALLRPDGAALAALTATIGDFRPDLIAVPALGDRHPDHGAAHVLVRLALAAQDHPPMLLTYLVHGQADAAEIIEQHGSAVQVAAKQAALAAYRTQMALSGGRMRHLADRPEGHVVLNEPPRVASARLPWRPSRVLQPWLRLSVASPAGTGHWPWRQAPLRRDGQGGWQLDWPAALGGGPCFAKLSLELPSPWIFDHWGWCEL